MTSLVKWLASTPARVADTQVTIDDWLSWFTFQGLQYPLVPTQTLGAKQEEITVSFMGFVEQIYKTNGPVFACMAVRLHLFSEARFQFRQMRKGRPGDLFGTQALGVLEAPWPNGSTSDLLKRAIQDADLSGNCYLYREGNVLRRLRPDWVTIVMGSKRDSATANWQLDAEVIGYIYTPGGMQSQEPPEVLMVDQVAHFAPIPDPTARFRGMSWLTPIVREIMADGAATTHKLKFFENGATPNMVVSLGDTVTPETFGKWIEKFEEAHEGVMNAYKTMYLGGGASVDVVGSNMEQLDFKVTQGAGETRVAAAAGVPPVIAGFSEGLASATYSNYQQARRRFADGTMRPLWRDMAHALQVLVVTPKGSELWYDDRDIPFLAEDLKDGAEIQNTKAITIQMLIAAGFHPDSVVKAVESDDLTMLVHTGLVSVQLQKPGQDPKTPSTDKAPSTGGNGNGNGATKSFLLPDIHRDRCLWCGDTRGSMGQLDNGRWIHPFPCLAAWHSRALANGDAP